MGIKHESSSNKLPGIARGCRGVSARTSSAHDLKGRGSDNSRNAQTIVSDMRILQQVNKMIVNDRHYHSLTSAPVKSNGWVCPQAPETLRSEIIGQLADDFRTFLLDGFVNTCRLAL